MSNKKNISSIITAQKILPIFNHADIEVVKEAVKACYNAGLKCFEFTNRNENAPEVFYELKKYCDAAMKDMLLGVGTIKNITDAEQFPGVAFLVSPFITKELIDYTTAKNILWVPGCGTASEIALAQNAGISLVKIFPAGLLGGVSFIKTMKTIFPNIKMLATGGVNPDAAEIKEWLNHADAVGLGSQLFKEGDADLITECLKKLLRKINE